MSHWYAIVPRPKLYYLFNYIKNPSFEKSVSDSWTAVGCTPAQDSTYAVHGRYCLKMDTSVGDDYIKSPNISLADDETAVLSAYVKTDASPNPDGSVRIYDETNTTYRATTTDAGGSDWRRIICSWKNETGSAVNISARIGDWTSGAASYLYIDAAQLVIYKTTAPAADCIELDYFDGDDDEAYWLGEPHNSRTKISEDTREHGQVLNLATDLGLEIDNWSGSGLPAYQLISTDWAQGPGGYVQRSRARARTVIMQSTVDGSSLADLYDKRLALVEALRPDLGRRNQPLRLFHLRPDLSYGDPDWRELRVYYDSGLEMQTVKGHMETLTLRLIAPDPYFYRERSAWGTLDPRDTPTTFKDFAARIDGEWINPANANPNGEVYCVCPSKALGKVYLCGSFTSWDNDANANYIVAYDPDSDSYEALGTGLNGIARAAKEGPDGQLYVVGHFSTAGGATAHRVAKWDGSSWTALSTTAPTSGNAYNLDFGTPAQYTYLYICGDFVDFNGSADLDGVARMNISGGGWDPLDKGITGGTVPGRAIAWDGADYIYVVGDLTTAQNTAGNVTVYGIARWNGAGDDVDEWQLVGNSAATNPGLYSSAIANDIVSDRKGNLYIAGDFDQADDLTVNHIARYDGRAFHALGDGIGWYTSPATLWYDADTDDLWLFDVTDVGSWGNLGIDYMAVWNGIAWRPVGLDPPAANTATGALMYGNVYYAEENDGTCYQEGVATLTNEGTERAWPVITLSAGPSGWRRLEMVRNLTTGVELYFWRIMGPDDEVVIDTRPGRRSAKDALGRELEMIPGSNLSEFYLVPGPNRIAIYIDNLSGTYDATARAEWRTIYGSAD